MRCMYILRTTKLFSNKNSATLLKDNIFIINKMQKLQYLNEVIILDFVTTNLNKKLRLKLHSVTYIKYILFAHEFMIHLSMN